MDDRAGTGPGSGDERRAGPPTDPAGHRVGGVPAQVAVVCVAAAVLGVILYLAQGALSPFIVGLLLVYLLDRPVTALARLGLPRVIGIPVVYAIVVLVAYEALRLTLVPLVEQAQSFGRELPALLRALDEQLRRLGELYRGLDLPPDVRRAIDAALADVGAAVLRFDPTVLLPVFGSVATFVASLFGYLVIPVWVFYILLDPRGLAGGLQGALPSAWRADAAAVGEIVRRVVGQWLRAQLILGAIVGLATYAGLVVLGALIDPVLARYALFLALIAGTFELLPVIGPIISAVPGVLVGATAGLEPMVTVLLLYLVIQQVENHLLVPKIQGTAIELHPATVIVAIVIGAAVGGLLGAVLALPIAATGRNVYRYFFARFGDPPVSVDEALASLVEGRRQGTAGGAGTTAGESPTGGVPTVRPPEIDGATISRAGDARAGRLSVSPRDTATSSSPPREAD